MVIAVIFLCIILVFTVVFIGFNSRAGQRGTFSEEDFSDQLMDDEYIRKRTDYLVRMKASHRKIKMVLFALIAMAFSIPFFVVLYDTITFSGKMDAERYAERMRDIYIFLGSMMGLGLLFFLLASLLMKKMTQNYRKVIMSLDPAHLEKMIEVNQYINKFDGFMMAPPFIIGQSELYVFKLGRVLVLPWKDITDLNIISAPRNGFFVRMKVWGKTYLFSIADRSVMNILETECVHKGISRSA